MMVLEKAKSDKRVNMDRKTNNEWTEYEKSRDDRPTRPNQNLKGLNKIEKTIQNQVKKDPLGGNTWTSS